MTMKAKGPAANIDVAGRRMRIRYTNRSFFRLEAESGATFDVHTDRIVRQGSIASLCWIVWAGVIAEAADVSIDWIVDNLDTTDGQTLTLTCQAAAADAVGRGELAERVRGMLKAKAGIAEPDPEEAGNETPAD